MNVLQIYNFHRIHFSEGLSSFGTYNIISKQTYENISFESYDAFMFHIDYLYKENEDPDFLEKLLQTKKPVIIIYDDQTKFDEQTVNYFRNNYNIAFSRTDVSVLEKEEFYFKFPGKIRDSYAISSDKEKMRVFVKNTSKGLIYKNQNLVIMHDILFDFGNLSNNEEYEEFINSTTILLNYIISNNIAADKPEWISNVIILDDNELLNEKKVISKNISDLEELRNKINDNLANNEMYKKLLYTNGDELVEVVKIVLAEMMNISINDIDVKKEDLSFKLGDKKILAEVKGINTGIKRGNVSQVENHILDDAYKENIDDIDIEKMYKGVLIVNPYDKHDLKEKLKKEIYSESVILDIKKKNIYTIDTITLLNLFSKYRNEKKSIDLKKAILETNYNEPDFGDIIVI